MVRSFFSGVSGLQVHLERMDVIGDNLANTNTIGFKKSNMTFKDFLSQTLFISQAPTATLGGVNPKQIGLGVKVGAITVDFSQGQLQRTGKTTDVAVEGSGFFVVKGQGGVSDLHYSRAGAFDFDSKGNLVDPGTGFFIQGWNSAVDSSTGQLVISPNVNPIENVKVNIGQTAAAKASTSVTFGGNLDATNAIAIDPITLSYVQNGVTRSFEISFQHTHPTKRYFYYTAKWLTNPPPGYKVNDSVIDSNTGKAVAGILELNADGTVKQNFIDTDDSEIANVTRAEYLDTLRTGSTVKLAAVRTIEHGNTDPNTALTSDKPGDMAGYWRITFDNANNLNRYKLEYSQNFDPGQSSTATWTTIAASADRSSDFQIRDDNGQSFAGQLVIRSTDWSGTAVTNDVLYFRTKKGNGNKIFDFPMELPKTVEDDWPSLRASDPSNKNSSGSGVLSNVYVNQLRDVDGANVAGGTADSATSRPNLSNGLSQTIWRAVYGNSASSNEYKLFYAKSYPSGLNSTSVMTWFDETSQRSFTTNTDSLSDFYTAVRTSANGYNHAQNITRKRSQDVITGKRDVNGDGDFSDITTDANNDGIDDVLGVNSTADVNARNTGELFIQTENWNSTKGGDLNASSAGYDGDVYEWRVSYAKSSTLNRDFFTVEEATTRLAPSPAFPRSSTVGANTLSLSTVTVDGSAPVDGTWTITFTSATNFTIAGSTFGTLGSGNTGSTFSSNGIKIEPSFWSGTGAATMTMTFATASTKVLSDFAIPGGNSGSEALTFSPNTNDVTFNEVTSGQPVKAKLKTANEYQFAASVNVFDSLGAPHVLKTVFERVSQNTWLWSVDDPTPNDINNVKLAGFGKLVFDDDGKFDPSNSEIFETEVGQEMKDTNRPSSLLQIVFDPADDGGAPPPAEGANRVDIAPDFSSLAQFAAPNDGQISAQDGFGKGTLQEININLAGIIVGLFDNGQAQDLAQISLANFVNPGGLLKEGNSYYRTTGNSGTAIVGVAQRSGRGNIIGGALEGSNVDLTVEFTEMIITQRGFQANSRTIRTADQMIQEVLALKQ